MENFTEKQIQETITSIEVGQEYWDIVFNAYIEVLKIDIDSNLIRLKGANRNTMLIRNQDGSFDTMLSVFAYEVLIGITILQK